MYSKRKAGGFNERSPVAAVSYTHLTLPTMVRV